MRERQRDRDVCIYVMEVKPWYVSPKEDSGHNNFAVGLGEDRLVGRRSWLLRGFIYSLLSCINFLPLLVLGSFFIFYLSRFILNYWTSSHSRRKNIYMGVGLCPSRNIERPWLVKSITVMSCHAVFLIPSVDPWLQRLNLKIKNRTLSFLKKV